MFYHLTRSDGVDIKCYHGSQCMSGQFAMEITNDLLKRCNTKIPFEFRETIFVVWFYCVVVAFVALNRYYS